MSIFGTSHAFKRGFYEGFAAMPRLFSPHRYTLKSEATDARAWREVGYLLNQSYREVGVENVKTPVKKHLKREGNAA